MSRPKLSPTFRTVVERFRMSEEVAEEFALRCEELGYTKSEQVRNLVERWLRQTAHMARVKAKALRG